MKKDELKDLMESTLEKSKELLLRDGYVHPVAFIYYGNEVDLVALTFENQEDKVKQIYALGKLAKMKKADAVCIVAESWYVTTDKKDLDTMPSKHPMRKECILISGECKEGDIAITQKFERKEIKNESKEKIIFGEKDIDTVYSSRFNFGIKKK
jgi:hypothetical protein